MTKCNHRLPIRTVGGAAGVYSSALTQQTIGGRETTRTPCVAGGCRHRATQLADSLIGDEAERLVRKVVERAMAGDSVCLRLCLERLSPPLKERPVEFELPPMAGAGAAVAAVAAVAEAVAAGQVTPSEALALAALVESYRKAVETQDLEHRVAALESYQGGKHG